MGPFSLYTLRTNAHPFPLQPAFPSSEYYGCVRLPPCHQPSSFVLVRFTGEPCVTGTCRVSLVPDLSLRSRHARLPRRTLRTLLYHCWSGSSVLASSTLNAWPSATTHFRGCMWVHGCRPDNHPSGPDCIGMFSGRPGLRIRGHDPLWLVRCPVYTSDASFFMSSLGIPSTVGLKGDIHDTCASARLGTGG